MHRNPKFAGSARSRRLPVIYPSVTLIKDRTNIGRLSGSRRTPPENDKRDEKQNAHHRKPLRSELLINSKGEREVKFACTQSLHETKAESMIRKRRKTVLCRLILLNVVFGVLASNVTSNRVFCEFLFQNHALADCNRPAFP